VFWLVTRLTLHHFNNKRNPPRQLPPVHCGFSLSDRLYVSGPPFLKFRSSSPTFDSTLVLDRSSMSALIIGDRSSSGRRRYCVLVFVRHACCEVDSHLPRFWSIRPRYRGSMGDGDIMEDMDSQLAFPTTAPLCSMSAPENPVDGTFCSITESSTRGSVIIELMSEQRDLALDQRCLAYYHPMISSLIFPTVAPPQTSEDRRTRPLRWTAFCT
jgi:hypothetical protein